MSTAYSGIAGTVTAGSTDMDVTGFSFDLEVNVIDVSTTADTGWDDFIGTTKKINGTFDFFYNIAKRPTGATAGLTPGSTPTLVLKTGGGDQITGSALITKISIKSAVKEAVAGTCTFQNKGPWTLPS